MPADSSPLIDGPVVVGVAEDDRSDPAVAMGLELARRTGATLELLHVIDDGGWPSPAADQAVPGVYEALSRRHADVVGRDGPAELTVTTGRPARGLLDRARELQAGLIVLGPHASHGLVDFGRTARAVVTHAACPVWVQPRTPESVRHVLAPVDMSEDSRAAALWARELALLLDARLTLLHAFRPPILVSPVPGAASPTYVLDDVRQEQERAFASFAEEIAPDGERHFVDGAPAEAILAEKDADVVVLATHGRGAVSRAILGSVTSSVMSRSERPTVALRHASRALELDEG